MKPWRQSLAGTYASPDGLIRLQPFPKHLGDEDVANDLLSAVGRLRVPGTLGDLAVVGDKVVGANLD